MPGSHISIGTEACYSDLVAVISASKIVQMHASIRPKSMIRCGVLSFFIFGQSRHHAQKPEMVL